MKTMMPALILSLASVLWANEWQLVWSDDFEGDALNLSNWSYQLGDGSSEGLVGWGNNESQYYREENAIVQNGMLRIVAKKESYKGYSYTSARIRSKDKRDWTYCRVEVRAKMPIGKGLWAALWMMPTDNVYGGWAASGEMDMVEYLGHEPNKVHGTLHFGGSWPQNSSKGKEYVLNAGDFHNEFHTFAYEWEEGDIRWYVDGELYQTLGEGDWWSSGGDFPAPFNQKFHLIFNLAVGGNWPGHPDVSTTFPQEFLIDYVRVYQKTTTRINQKINNPDQYGLLCNVPNPFNPSTKISFLLSKQEYARLDVYDVNGRLINTLVDEVRQKGRHNVLFDAKGMTSGLYICKLSCESGYDTKRMLFLK